MKKRCRHLHLKKDHLKKTTTNNFFDLFTHNETFTVETCNKSISQRIETIDWTSTVEFTANSYKV